MGTSGSIYWCKKAGGIISTEKTHDAIQAKPNDLEGQANETKQSLIIYEIQAHAHGDNLPKPLQPSEVLPTKNERQRRPAYTGRVVTQSSDPALATQFPKPNQAWEWKRQAQDSEGEGFPKKTDKM